MKLTVIPFVTCVRETVPPMLRKETGRVENQKTNQDNSIVDISKNTEKSPGDLRRLATTDTSERPSANGGMKNCQCISF